jgi:hypothetical protein
MVLLFNVVKKHDIHSTVAWIQAELAGINLCGCFFGHQYNQIE